MRLATVAEPTLIIGTGTLGPAPAHPDHGVVAMGRDARAEGPDAIALGTGAKATSHSSFARGAMALGTGTEARSGSTAVGGGANALGLFCNAVGVQSWAYGEYCMAIGPHARTGAQDYLVQYALAIQGSAAEAHNAFAAAHGLAQGEASIAIGGYAGGFKSFGAAMAAHSVAFGRGTATRLPDQVILGRSNVDPYYPPETIGSLENPLFIIGNGSPVDPGQQPAVRSNAFTVSYNGNTWVQGGLTVEGGTVAAPVETVFTRNVKVKGVLRVEAPAGDISMGGFTAGPQP